MAYGLIIVSVVSWIVVIVISEGIDTIDYVNYSIYGEGDNNMELELVPEALSKPAGI